MSEIDYGPLKALVGTWSGDKGLDIAPEPDGREENPYTERLVVEEIGDVTNAEAQTLVVVNYHQVVTRKSNGEVFHDQTGYWMWDAQTQTVMHSLQIPRAVTLLAGGKANLGDEGSLEIEVEAKQGSPDWGIVQQPFMLEKAKTTAFKYCATVKDNVWKYSETTSLEIYGKPFEHTDENELIRE